MSNNKTLGELFRALASRASEQHGGGHDSGGHGPLCHNAGEFLGQYGHMLNDRIGLFAHEKFGEAMIASKGKDNCWLNAARHILVLQSEFEIAFAEELLAMEVYDTTGKVRDNLKNIASIPKNGWGDVPSERVDAVRARAQAVYERYLVDQEEMEEKFSKGSVGEIAGFIDEENGEAMAVFKGTLPRGQSDLPPEIISEVINEVIKRAGVDPDDPEIAIVRSKGDGTTERVDKHGFPWVDPKTFV